MVQRKTANRSAPAWAIILSRRFALPAAPSHAVTLSVRGSSFLLDGKPAFLLGMSYYAGLGAPDESVRRDFRDLKRRGFNWVRVFATWTAYGDVLLVDLFRVLANSTAK